MIDIVDSRRWSELIDSAPTITSLPDDLLHYSEPRTLTVRENARLQSFPDWFRFRGNYTTGGTAAATKCYDSPKWQMQSRHCWQNS